MASSSGFSSLADYSTRFVKAFPKIALGIVQEVVRACHKEVVTATPVDTGLARSNWIVSLGTPVAVVIRPYAQGSHLGVAETQNAAAAISAGSAVIDAAGVGTTTFIVQNNVPYIGELNAGSSKQAPALFVEKGIDAGIVKLNGLKLNFVI
jgi:hypothetical protein